MGLADQGIERALPVLAHEMGFLSRSLVEQLIRHVLRRLGRWVIYVIAAQVMLGIASLVVRGMMTPAGSPISITNRNSGQGFGFGGIASSDSDAVKELYLLSSPQRVRKKGLPLVGPQKLVGAAHPSRQPRRQRNESEPGGLL